ncbi:MAG: hypothetical protein QM702_20630 [Rubrivivax sp.]
MNRRARYIATFLLALFMYPLKGAAQANSESDLLLHIAASFVQADSDAYAAVFPSADSIVAITLRRAPDSTEQYAQARALAGNTIALADQDSLIRKNAFVLFRYIFYRGSALGVHWSDVLMNRYELEALHKTRDAALEAVAPERFVGYVFLEDMQTRKIFTLALSDIRKMEGKWYGGEANFIFEAKTKDEFNQKLKAEKKRILKGLADSVLLANNVPPDSTVDEDEISMKRKQVAERKYYIGWLDDDIPVDLYIRYLKGDCPGGICSYDAMIRFGEDNFIRYEVVKNKDGKWIFTEEETGGVLEVELKGNIFSGIFSATTDRIDYDAYLKEKNMSKRKLEYLDEIMDEDLNH